MHVGRLLVSFPPRLTRFGSVLTMEGDLLARFWMLLAQVLYENFIDFGVDLRRCVFSRITLPQIAKTTNPQAKDKQTRAAWRNARSRLESLRAHVFAPNCLIDYGIFLEWIRHQFWIKLGSHVGSMLRHFASLS
jgi:hypothetical protein